MTFLKHLKNIFRIGKKTKNIDSITVELNFLGKTQESKVIVPWGMFIKTPSDVNSAILRRENNEDDLYTILFDLSNVDTITGESGLAIGIPQLKDRIIFKDTGMIVFKIGDTEGGDFAVRYIELNNKLQDLISQFNEFRETTYALHTHQFNYNAGVTPSSGTTLTGTPTGDNIDVDFSDAMVQEIQLPEKG